MHGLSCQNPSTTLNNSIEIFPNTTDLFFANEREELKKKSIMNQFKIILIINILLLVFLAKIIVPITRPVFR